VELALNHFDLKEYLSVATDDLSVESPNAFRDEVVDLFYGETKDEGAYLPWPKLADKFRFRPGEVTLWPGINGHGKSQVTALTQMDMAYNGERVAVASFEMAPKRTLARMLRQASCSAEPSRRYIDEFMEYFDGKLHLINRRGMVDQKYVEACVRYCVDKLGVTQFFIDNLTKCVKGDDDYNGQKNFIDAMCAAGMDTGCHIHIVHHIRKGEDEYKVPGKFDVKGTGAITDQVDNTITVWRNKRKEGLIAKGKATPENMEEPDCVLAIDKQRNGSWEGNLALWYDHESMSYTDEKRGRPRYYRISRDHSNDF
jgi:twinkle protein